MSEFLAKLNIGVVKRKFSSFCTETSQITHKHLLLSSQFFRWSSCGRCAWPRCSTTWTSWGWRGPATCTSSPPGPGTTSTRCSTARRPPGTASSKVMSLTSTAGPARCVCVWVKGTVSWDLLLIFWMGLQSLLWVVNLVYSINSLLILFLSLENRNIQYFYIQ